MKKSTKKIDIVVLYSSGHLGSMIVLNRLLKMNCYNIKGIVSSSVVNMNRNSLKKAGRQFRKMGICFFAMLIFQRLVQAFAFGLTYTIPYLRRRLKPSSEIAEELHIPIHHTESVNNEETLKFIKSLKPELMISAYFSQILKKDALEIPNLGVLNIHPGLIPEYKGAMAYFWAVKNGEKRAGVTVHWMDEGIDTGPILMQKSFKIPKKMTQEKVLVLSAVIGSRLIHRTGKNLVAGKPLKKLTLEKKKPGYFSLPTAKDYFAYRTKHKMFHIKSLLAVIITTKPPAS